MRRSRLRRRYGRAGKRAGSGEREISDLLAAQERPTMRAPALTAKQQLELDRHLQAFLDELKGAQ
jgi:hypothetical protein